MKSKKKVKVFFTLDSEVSELFDTYIDDNLLDKSRLIEHLIKEYLQSKKKD